MQAPPSRDLFPFRRFQLELDGVVQGAFEELEMPSRVADERDGAVVRRWTPLRLVRGVANTRELLDWLKLSLDRRGARVAVVVELDDEGLPVCRHTFASAWPFSVQLATLETDETFFDVAALALSIGGWRAEAVGDPVA